jgi:hypothetical protein
MSEFRRIDATGFDQLRLGRMDSMTGLERISFPGKAVWLLYYCLLGAVLATVCAIRIPWISIVFVELAGAGSGLVIGYIFRSLLFDAYRTRRIVDPRSREHRRRLNTKRLHAFVGCIHGAIVGYLLYDYYGFMTGTMAGLFLGALSGDIQIIVSLKLPGRPRLSSLVGTIADTVLACVVVVAVLVWSDRSAAYCATLLVPILAIRIFIV